VVSSNLTLLKNITYLLDGYYQTPSNIVLYHYGNSPRMVCLHNQESHSDQYWTFCSITCMCRVEKIQLSILYLIKVCYMNLACKMWTHKLTRLGLSYYDPSIVSSIEHQNTFLKKLYWWMTFHIWVRLFTNNIKSFQCYNG
jgi:hypothetical protein